MSPLPVAAPMTVPVQDRAMPAIQAIDLRKEFRRRERVGRRFETTRSVALAPTTFRVERGECVAILGQNGSGKSTLVRLLSTLLLPDGGTARVFGHDIRTDARAVRRLVNRVSVEASFFKKLSAFENLSYAARFYGIRPADSRVRIPEIVERLSFPADRLREPMEHLSRGMQQKIALARALLTAPVVLLLDEPTTGLDPRSKLEVQALVTDMQEQHDATVLLCTHDLAEAEELARRVGILHRGELIALEAAAGLKLRYGAATLEEAFFAATGGRLEDEADREADEGGGSP
ncbi:MAG: type transport system ATP-binding protein [Actinomycetota bacterium]|nr:type transport system ATP-binding protein [Actinomycetota bacterium]